MATEKFLDLSSFNDLDIKSVRMRALNGDDLIVAAGRCAPMDGGTLDATLFSLMLRQQQIAQSIIEVDGSAIRGPCLASLKWNYRTRDFVAMIYDRLNGIEADERERFMAALIGASAAKTQDAEPTKSSSESGSGSPGT